MTLVGLSLRNVFRHKRRTFFLSTSIGFGVFAIVFANSASNGMVENFYDTFSSLFSGHVRLEGRESNGTAIPINIIRNDSKIYNRLNLMRDKIKFVSKKTSFQGTLLYGGKSRRQVITGVDFDADKVLKSVLAINEGSIEGMKDKKGIVLSHETAKKLKIGLGDTFIVQLTTVTGQINVGEFILVATAIDMGIIGGYFAFANIGYVNSLVDMLPDEYNSLDIYFKDNRSLPERSAELKKHLSPEINVLSKEMSVSNRPDEFFKTLKGTAYTFRTLEDSMEEVKQVADGFDHVAYLLSFFVFIVVFVGINNSFKIILRDRIREIGTLRALGMRKKDVTFIFVAEAELIALFGNIGGLLIALLTMLVIHYAIDFGTDSPFAILLRNGRVFFSPTWFIVFKGFCLSTILVFFAVFFTCKKAAAKSPADTLRAIS